MTAAPTSPPSPASSPAVEPPLVVGTIRPLALEAYAAWALDAGDDDGGPDLVEARLDLAIAPDEPRPADTAALPDLRPFLAPCRQLETAGTPVLATVRLEGDGGRWTVDAERLPWFEEAVEATSWIDIEVDSAIAADVLALARRRGRRVIVSHHEFSGTPDVATIEALIDRAAALGGDVVKIATRVGGLEDHDTLCEVMRRRRGQPLALVAMGPLGVALRSYLPCVGSRLTYGFLDASAAPGQIPARDLVARLLTDCPAYAEARRGRQG